MRRYIIDVQKFMRVINFFFRINIKIPQAVILECRLIFHWGCTEVFHARTKPFIGNIFI